MAYLRVSLVVLTLLQLCRAEISDKQPESWYAANVINDGFQPKPISEIFSTEASFSSTNPIVVLSKSQDIPDEIALLSTLPPPTRLQTTTIPEGFTSIPSTLSTPSSLASTESSRIYPTSQSQSPSPHLSSTNAVETQTNQQETTRLEIITPEIQPAAPTIQPDLLLAPEEPKIESSLPEELSPSVIQFTSPVIQQNSPTIQPVPPPADPPVPQSVQPIVELVQSNNTPSSRSQTGQTQSQQIRLELIPPVQNLPNQPPFNQPELQVSQFVTQVPSSPTSTSLPQTNYFLIYQQAPQNIQNYPLPPQSSISTSKSSSVSLASSQATMPQPALTVSAPSVPSSPPQMAQPTTTLSTTISTESMPTTATATVVVTRTTTTVPTTTNKAINQSLIDARNTSSPLPSSVTTPIARPLSSIPSYPLRIRVIAPPGSITNIRLNPTTTTKKPKTPRTRKPKPKARKNSYDVCIDSCKGRRDPLCAAPLSLGLVDPNTLKGFPSICHMACHNSFKKDTYEKLVDGRCGKLRTRIRTVDSNTKLKKDELNKAEYTLDNGPKTIVEVSGTIN